MVGQSKRAYGWQWSPPPPPPRRWTPWDPTQLEAFDQGPQLLRNPSSQALLLHIFILYSNTHTKDIEQQSIIVMSHSDVVCGTNNSHQKSVGTYKLLYRLCESWTSYPTDLWPVMFFLWNEKKRLCLTNYILNLRSIDYKEKQHQGWWIAQDMKVGVSGDHSWVWVLLWKQRDWKHIIDMKHFSTYLIQTICQIESKQDVKPLQKCAFYKSSGIKSKITISRLSNLVYTHN